MKLSVIIPAHNASRTIGLCLESVYGQTVKPDEVILVDDCSTDDTCIVARSYGSTAIIRSPAQKGPAFARNCGAAEATGDILIFVDADITLPCHAIKTIIDYFTADAALSCLCGIYSPKPMIARNFIAYYRCLQSYVWKRSGCGFTTRFTVACGAIRRHVFEAVGGFNEKFLNADIEDYEIGHRIIAKGYAILQTEAIQCDHDDIHRFRDLVVLLFRRSFLYANLLLQRRALDTGYLNKRRMLVYPLALCSISMLVLSVWKHVLLFPWALSVMLIAILDYGLYKTMRREKGVFFMFISIPVHYAISTTMAFAFLLGAIVSITRQRFVRP